MLELNENGWNCTVTLKNKLSIDNVSDIVCFESQNKIILDNMLPLKFTSNSVSSENEDILNGHFTLSDEVDLSVSNSIKVQELYLQWEAEQLERKTVTFKVPTNRFDCKSGVAPYNPYFFAVVNKLARKTHGFDLIGFGEYLNRLELKFVHQYCSFHPELREYISIKDELGSSERVSISCRAFELVVDSALAHVAGFRDKLRFKALYDSRSMPIDVGFDSDDFATTKFLIEYDHVLDSPSIWKESIDFYNYESSGGFLDVLNLPFQI